MSYYNDFLNFCIDYMRGLGITKTDIDEYAKLDADNDIWSFLVNEDIAAEYGESAYGTLQNALSEEFYNSNIKPSKEEVIDYISDYSVDGFADMLANAGDSFYDTFADMIDDYGLNSTEDLVNATKTSRDVYDIVEDVYMNSVCFGFPDEYMNFWDLMGNSYNNIYNSL